MAKELDPGLFGESSLSVARTVEKPRLHLDQLEGRVVDLRHQIREIKEEVQAWISQTEEYRKLTGTRLDQLQNRMSALEQTQNRVGDEVVLKVSQLHHRLGDRKLNEKKVQDLIDRHHSVLKSAELRMTQLQRLVEEKEAQVMSAQGALNDARMEIARMKRL